MMQTGHLPWTHRLLPFLLWWPMVNRQTTRADLLAGFTGALIVLPQGVAFATIAGLPPQYGLYSAMVPAVIGALWGSSWHLVSGPTTAISIAVFAALSHQAEPGSEQYIQLVLTLTFLVGLFQLLLGLARMGALVNFISHTVVIGFTTGAAILIAASQVRNFFGIQIARGMPFYEILHQLFAQLGDINPWVLAVSMTTLATGILVKRHVKKIPYMIAAMIIGSLLAELLNHWHGQSATGIRTVGALPGSLPPLSLPDFSLDTLRHTVGPALVITMLALTEAVSIARAIAVRSEQRIDGNQEFIGQGLSNIIGSFFSAYASSGSFNRSGVNFEAGAKTPLASVVASFVLIVVLLLVAPLAAYLPDAAMAGILFLVAWGLIDVHHIVHIWQTSKIESLILAATLVGTLFNLEMGIFIGVFLSLVFFLYRSSKPEIISVVPAPEAGAYHFVRAENRPECPQLRIVRINGPLYFGAASHVQSTLQQIDESDPARKSVLIAGASLSYIDIAGAEVLAQEARRRRRMGGGLYFYRLNEASQQFLHQGGYARDIGIGGFFPVMTNVTGALYWTFDPDICRSCKSRIFRECNAGILPDGLRRQRLMLATQGGQSSKAAEIIAVDLANRMGVTLDIVTVVTPEVGEKTAQENLRRVMGEAGIAGLDVKTYVRPGRQTDETIVAAAAEVDSNILVIGRPSPCADAGHPLPSRFIQQIIQHSPCHILIVGTTASPCHQRILLATNGAAISQRALDMAIQIAKPAQLPVTVLAAIDTAEKHARAEVDVARKLDELRVEGIACDSRIVRQEPVQAIIEAVRETHADLVIIGNDQRKGISRKLAGQTTDRVVGSLDCAVLVVKRPPEPADLIAAVRNQA